VAARTRAIDASEETLEIARSRVNAADVAFEVGDAYALPADARGFEAGFAGFWYSHIPLGRVAGFLRGFHRCLAPGARVVLLDNRYVEGSNIPIAETDDEGNTYQSRRLDDGSTHRVLKNFPTEAQLREATAGIAEDACLHQWTYYWALEYTVRRP
jgi:ubiquinone/menaquinone biosynthesis C-methylase UbiE